MIPEPASDDSSTIRLSAMVGPLADRKPSVFDLDSAFESDSEPWETTDASDHSADSTLGPEDSVSPQETAIDLLPAAMPDPLPESIKPVSTDINEMCSIPSKMPSGDNPKAPPRIRTSSSIAVPLPLDPEKRHMPPKPPVKATLPPHDGVFEGTNEIFIQSDIFDSIRSGVEKCENFGLPVPPPAPPVPPLPAPPVPPPLPAQKISVGKMPAVPNKNRQAPSFEGTNEIYIQSHVFDAICEDAENDSRPGADKNPLSGIRPAVPRALTETTDDRNILGIINSGILPSVEIDRSLEMPSPDDSMFSAVDMISESTPRADADSETSLQPQDEVHSAKSRRQPNNFNPHEFVLRHLYNIAFNAFGAMDWNGDGCQTEIDAAFAALADLSKAKRPLIFYLNSPCICGRERFARAFIERCMKDIPKLSVYTDTLTSSSDLITALFSSRIGLLRTDDATKKTDRLLNFAESLFKTEDRRWGQNILFARFGLEKLIATSKTADNALRTSDPECDAIELLNYCISRDAENGPVVVLLSESGSDAWTPWRDILYNLRLIKSPNVLILMMGTEPPKGEDVNVQELYPLAHLRMVRIFESMLTGYDLTHECIEELVNRSGDSLTQICRVAELFKHKHPLKIYRKSHDPKEILADIQTYPSRPESLDVAFSDTFSEDARTFLGIASLLGHGFFIADVVRLTSLLSLKDDILGLKKQRESWCRQIVSKLVDSRDIVRISSDAENGSYYEIPEWRLHRRMMHLRDHALACNIHGCYAHILEARKANPLEIANQYALAGMMTEAATRYLDVAREYRGHYFLTTTDTLVSLCLEHVGPQHFDLYTSLMFERISLNLCRGNYINAFLDAETVHRVSCVSDDTRCEILSYIAAGESQRLLGEFNRARDLLSFAVKQAEKLKDSTLTSASYHALGRIMFEAGAKGALVNALRYAEKALEIRRRDGDLHDIAQTQTLCAQIYGRRGEPQRAKAAATEAYRGFLTTGYWYEAPIALIALADSVRVLGEYGASEYLERAFSIVDKTSHLEHRVELLKARLRMTVSSLQRQAARDDLVALNDILQDHPLLPWQTSYQLLNAMFDFSRKNYKKTAKSLGEFFEHVQKLGNSYMLSVGYALSAELNTEVLKRELGTVSLEKTEKLYTNATSLFESIGAWHDVAETLRKYADFLDFIKRPSDAYECRARADKVDPYPQQGE